MSLHDLIITELMDLQSIFKLMLTCLHSMTNRWNLYAIILIQFHSNQLDITSLKYFNSICFVNVLPDDGSMSWNMLRHCTTNKLSYAQWNVSEVFDIYIVVFNKRNKLIYRNSKYNMKPCIQRALQIYQRQPGGWISQTCEWRPWYSHKATFCKTLLFLLTDIKPLMYMQAWFINKLPYKN
jgi:hypothetical protein